MLSRLLMIGLLLFAMVFWHPVSNAEEAPADSQEISEDAFVVLVAKLGSVTLFDELFGYLHNDSVLVPLSLVVEALEFPIEVNVAEGLADGWFLAENRRFALNLSLREAVTEGQKLTIPKDLPAIIQDDDIFVDVRLLEQWFPLKMHFSFNELALLIDPQEPLPIQQRLARKEWREKHIKRKLKEPVFPYLDLPRSWLSWPQMDYTLNVNLQPDAEGAWSPSFSYSTAVNMSLLTLDSEWFFSGSQENLLSSARVNFSHPGFDQGWLKGTRVSFGDQSSPATTHVASSKNGIGLQLTNIPLDTPDRFDQITLEDNLPPGWEVELYHNGQLLDFREIKDDGRYRFEDIDLLFGENIFRLVAYGPQGEKREKYKRYRIGQNMVLPGEFRYRLALHQVNANLLPVTTDTGSLSANDKSYRYSAKMEWGATDWLTLNGRWNRLQLADNQPYDFMTLGGRASLLGSSLEWDTTFDLNAEEFGSSSATQVHLQTQFGDVQAVLHYDYYDHFISETVTSTSSVSQLSWGLRGVLDLSVIGLASPVSWEWSSIIEKQASEPFKMDAGLRLATYLYGISLSNNLVWSHHQGWSRIDSAEGELLFSGRLHDAIRSKGTISYQLKPEAYFERFSLNNDIRLGKDLTLGLNADYDLYGGKKAQYSMSLNKNIHHKDFTLGVNLGYEEDFSIGLGLSFSFGQQNNRWQISSERMTGKGTVVARSFVDMNNNDQYDPEEDTLVENVRYRVNGREHKTKSNADGEAALSDLSLSKTSNISIVLDSLPDPFLAPKNPGVAIKANLGTVTTLDFPLVSTGEVDGVVYLLRNGKPQAIKAALQLLDPKNNIVQQVRSTYDGFYLFSYVPMGKYQIRVEPDLASQLDPTSVKPIDIEIKPGEEFLNGIDMLLKPILATAEEKNA